TISDFDDAGMGSDFSIKFGAAGQSSSDLFLSSEFGSPDADGNEGMVAPGMAPVALSFHVELEIILRECRELGFPDPLVAFSETASHATCTELRVGGMPESDDVQDDADGKKVKSKKAKTGKAALLEQLREQLGAEIPEECVGFIPMTPAENGQERFLAIAAPESNPVAATLTALRAKRTRMPSARVLDNEVSVYLGVARTAYYLVSSNLSDEDEFESAFGAMPLLPGDSRKTLVVRAGSEDTLVLFLEDDKLLHYESLRSITTYDAPETICSRVLLLQDEYGIGDVQHVLLLSEDREEAIVESFKMFFSDTRVESIRAYVPHIANADDSAVITAGDVLATGTALRLVKDDLYQGAFEDINLLPKKLLKRKFKLPVTWHIFALYALIFASVLFWISRFFVIENKVDEKRQLLAQYPVEYLNEDPTVLQARVDSLNAVTEGYKRALRVLDSLLIGSDAWSRSLELASNEVSTTRGIWIDSWRPSGDRLLLEGNATSRDRIVELARRTDSDIESVTFSEIREWPVYSFTMRMRQPRSLPEAAKYLREQVQLITEREQQEAALTSGAVGTN
ncbi:MAG: PilN domain-containing protein, partial [Rhodothermales bacterium]|nr:PilN domain-containing protein [Rhodothermales bacterium]